MLTYGLNKMFLHPEIFRIIHHTYINVHLLLSENSKINIKVLFHTIWIINIFKVYRDY